MFVVFFRVRPRGDTCGDADSDRRCAPRDGADGSSELRRYGRWLLLLFLLLLLLLLLAPGALIPPRSSSSVSWLRLANPRKKNAEDSSRPFSSRAHFALRTRTDDHAAMRDNDTRYHALGGLVSSPRNQPDAQKKWLFETRPCGRRCVGPSWAGGRGG